jgi:hypothetical protein
VRVSASAPAPENKPVIDNGKRGLVVLRLRMLGASLRPCRLVLCAEADILGVLFAKASVRESPLD